jgi:hypothetical protein
MTFVHQNHVVVVNGSLDRDAVRAAFEAKEFEARGEHHGYSFLTAQGAGGGVAVGADDLVGVGLYMGAVEEPLPVLEVYVDARAGRVERWVDSDEDLAALLDAFETPHYLRVRLVEPTDTHDPETGRFLGAVGRGHGWAIEGRTLTGRWAIPFESTDTVDVQSLRTWVDANRERGQRFADWRDVAVDATDGVGVVTARMDAQDY